MMATSGPPRLKARNEVVVIRVFPIMVNLTSLDRLAKETSGGQQVAGWDEVVEWAVAAWGDQFSMEVRLMSGRLWE